MEPEYKPLFNRTYLKILLWIVAVAIVWLSALNHQDDHARPESFEDQPWLTYLVDKEVNNQRVYLTFALPPAYSPNAQIQQRALRTALTQQLANMSLLNGHVLADRVQLYIPVNEADHLKQQLQQLIHATAQHMPAVYQHVQAEHYLETQALETFALYNLALQLNNQGPEITTLTQLLAYRPRVLIVAHQKPQALLTIFRQQWGQYPTYPITHSPRKAPIQLTLQHRSRTGLTLLATETSAQPLLWPLTMHYLQQRLSALSANTTLEYRLRLAPGLPGYAALLFKTKATGAYQQLMTLAPQISKIDRTLLEHTKEQFRNHYDQQSTESDKRIDQLITAQFYGYPFTFEEAFHDTLDQIDSAQVEQALQQLLNADKNIQITVTPQ